ncbi:MAG: ankyrin repeat domain-containing protein [Clostridiales bacterium]|nr:ankyrin repeat domain-containing protein [Clostridiales bacterium]
MYKKDIRVDKSQDNKIKNELNLECYSFSSDMSFKGANKFFNLEKMSNRFSGLVSPPMSSNSASYREDFYDGSMTPESFYDSIDGESDIFTEDIEYLIDDTSFLNGVDLNDEVFIEIFLKAEEDPILCKSFVDRMGKTMLMYAAQHDVDLRGTGKDMSQKEIIEYLVNMSPDTLYYRDINDKSALTYAVASGDMRIVCCFINLMEEYINDDMKWELEQFDNMGKTLLMHAVESGNKELVKYLVEEMDANINKTDNNGKTILRYALDLKNVALLKYFIEERNADIYAVDNTGKNLLEHILDIHELDFIGQLIGINDKKYKSIILDYLTNIQNVELIMGLLDRKDRKGRNVLYYAIEKNTNIFYKIEEKCKLVNCVDYDGITLLMYAIIKGKKDIARYLKENGAYVKCADSKGKTALIYAIEKDNKEIIHILSEGKIGELNDIAYIRYAIETCDKNLLEYVVDKNDEDGKTVLMHAVEMGNVEMARYLLQRDNDVSIKDKDGKNVLMYALELKNLSVINLFKNKVDMDGRNILYYAARSKDMLQRLKKIIDIRRQDTNGNTVLTYVAEQGIDENIPWLLSHGLSFKNDNNATKFAVKLWSDAKLDRFIKNMDVDKVLMYALEFGKKNRVKYMIDKGANLNAIDEEGRTMLMYAAKAGNIEYVKKLIGIYTNAKDKTGKTAVTYAMESFNFDIASYLIDYGIEIGNITAKKETILIRAIKEKNCRIVNLLLELGANVNEFDLNGKTALMHTIEQNDRDMVECVLDSIKTSDELFQDGKTLMYAVGNGSDVVVKYLLDQGASIDEKDDRGVTAMDYLMYIISSNHSNVKNVLKQFVNKKNKYGFTVLSYMVSDAMEEESKYSYIEEIRFLLENGAFARELDFNGISLLMYAIKIEDMELVEDLVENKMLDVNHVDNFGESVIQYAVKSGDAEMFEYIIDKGAVINGDIWDMLVYAVKSPGDSKIAQYLINNYDINLNERDDDGNTILMYALETGKIELVSELINRGALVTVRNDKGENILMCASKSGRVDVINYLIKKDIMPNVNEKTRYGVTALMIAASKRNKPICRRLLALGANVSCVDNEGRDALFYAALEGSKNLVEYFLRKRRNKFKYDKNYKTLLMYAIESNNNSLIWHLIKRKESLVATDIEKRTVLMYAAQEGNENLVKYLVEKGLKVNVEDKEHNTVLMYAVMSGNLSMAEYLVSKGANVDVCMDRLQLIDEAQAKTNDAFLKSVNENNLNLVKFWVGVCGACVNYCKGTETPFIVAVKLNNNIICDYLIYNGADINMPDDNGKNPLMYAIESGNENMFWYLIDNDADVSEVDGNEKTALMYAARAGKLSMVKYLTKILDLNQIDKCGRTEIMYAAMSKNVEVIQYLLDRGARVDIVDNDGYTFFTYLADVDLEDIAYNEGELEKTIVKKVWDVNVEVLNKQDIYGKTALIHAVESGNKFMVNLLLSKNVDISLRDNTKRTAKDHAYELRYFSMVNSLNNVRAVSYNTIDRVYTCGEEKSRVKKL